MGRQIAGIDLGAAIQGVMGGDSLTLGRRVSGAEPTDPNAAPAQSITPYPCQGYPSAIRRDRVAESLVRKRMVIFGIYGNTLPLDFEPDEGDIVTDDKGRIHEVYFTDGDSVQGVWILYTTRTQ